MKTLKKVKMILPKTLILDLGYKKKLTKLIIKINAEIIILGFANNTLSLFTPILNKNKKIVTSTIKTK